MRVGVKKATGAAEETGGAGAYVKPRLSIWRKRSTRKNVYAIWPAFESARPAAITNRCVPFGMRRNARATNRRRSTSIRPIRAPCKHLFYPVNRKTFEKGREATVSKKPAREKIEVGPGTNLGTFFPAKTFYMTLRTSASQAHSRSRTHLINSSGG